MTKIYTKKGDKGKTALFDGTAVEKFDDRVEAYGTIDELNSFVGLAYENIFNREFVKGELTEIQHDLLDIGSALANPHALPVIGLAGRVLEIEKAIDFMTKQMPPLKNFILPEGRKAVLLHVCRTVCRRAERRVAKIKIKDEGI